jgi:hypothetical protein
MISLNLTHCNIVQLRQKHDTGKQTRLTYYSYKQLLTQIAGVLHTNKKLDTG